MEFDLSHSHNTPHNVSQSLIISIQKTSSYFFLLARSSIHWISHGIGTHRSIYVAAKQLSRAWQQSGSCATRHMSHMDHYRCPIAFSLVELIALMFLPYFLIQSHNANREPHSRKVALVLRQQKTSLSCSCQNIVELNCKTLSAHQTPEPKEPPIILVRGKTANRFPYRSPHYPSWCGTASNGSSITISASMLSFTACPACPHRLRFDALRREPKPFAPQLLVLPGASLSHRPEASAVRSSSHVSRHSSRHLFKELEFVFHCQVTPGASTRSWTPSRLLRRSV